MYFDFLFDRCIYVCVLRLNFFLILEKNVKFFEVLLSRFIR